MFDYRNLPTGELMIGDTVLTHGMRVLLDTRPRVWEDDRGRNVYAFSGLVLNVEEVRVAGVVPIGWLYQEPNTGRVDYTREPRWTVQGNDLATWTVEPGAVAVEA